VGRKTTDPVSTEEWALSASASVMARSREFIDSAAASKGQRTLLRLALEEHRVARARDAEWVPAVHLPLLVFEAVCGQSAPVDLPVACGFIELGADLLDHVADDELDPRWDGVPRGLVGLVATGFIGAIPQLLLADLPVDAERRISLQRTMAEKLFLIGAGQQVDLELAGRRGTELAQVETAVLGKTGERRALYARLAAELAGASADVIASYETVARELAAARQIASDCTDLFGREWSRDLRAGSRSWPIAWALSRLENSERARLLSCLEACRDGQRQDSAVKVILREQGVLRAAGLRIQVSCQKALRILDGALPRELAAGRMRSMIRAAGAFVAGAASRTGP